MRSLGSGDLGRKNLDNEGLDSNKLNLVTVS